MSKSKTKTRRTTPTPTAPFRYGNTALFEKVKRALRRDAAHYDQNHFCGTAMCIAGHAVCQAGVPMVYQGRAVTGQDIIERNIRMAEVLMEDSANSRTYQSIPFPLAACRLLGLGSIINHSLFSSTDRWPADFRRAYGRARSPLGRAKVGIARIEHYQRTGE